jgi:CheY-like chemotaxis protein
MAKILMVDDDTEFTRMVQEILEGEGYHVTTVHTGQDGFRAFTREADGQHNWDPKVSQWSYRSRGITRSRGNHAATPDPDYR